MRVKLKKAGDQSDFALGKSPHHKWGFETKQRIENMITQGAGYQELYDYIQNQGLDWPRESPEDETLQAGASQAETPQPVTSQARDTRQARDPRRWSEREEIILAKSRAEGLSYRQISKRLPGRTAVACEVRWSGRPKKERDRLMRLASV